MDKGMRKILRVHEPLVDSTMNAITDHLHLLEEHPEGVVAFSADTQSAGRGREGRRWVTAGKAVATSFALRLGRRREPSALQVLALAIIEALGSLYKSDSFQIKWPNDIIIAHEKVGGMIAEWVEDIIILGFGLNLKVSEDAFPERCSWPAGSIEHILKSDRSYEASQVIEAVIARFLKHLPTWEAVGLGPFIDLFNSKLLYRGRFVTIRSSDQPIRGLLDGIDENGQIRLRLGSGSLISIATGELLFSAQFSSFV